MRILGDNVVGVCNDGTINELVIVHVCLNQIEVKLRINPQHIVGSQLLVSGKS